MSTFNKALKYNLGDSLAFFFLDYFNNFLTVEVFAEHYGETVETAHKVIEQGREFEIDFRS